jgi:ATP-dependent Clp protease ATP-binding subunit ClpA/ATP-dependent Clp protease ATP-binding subunit ClpC
VSLQVTIPLFERQRFGWYEVATVGLGPLSRRREGRSPHKIDAQITTDLREAIKKLPVRDLEHLQPARGVALQHVRLELTMFGETERRKLTGLFPLIIEPRWTSDDARISIVHHPFVPAASFPLRPDLALEDQARLYFTKAWANLDEELLELLPTRGREALRFLSFNADTRTLLDDLPKKPGSALLRIGEDPADRKQQQARGLSLLPKLAVNLTELAATEDLDIGTPRGVASQRLGMLLGAAKRQPTVVLGPPGAGKTTAIDRFITEALEADGYAIHRNLDRCRKVFLLAGKRIIAGMSHVGEWEERCLTLLDEARRHHVLLVISDLHHFGRIGRSRQSDRCLADLFKGPLARREVVLVGESTPDAWKLLEEEAPSFASLFTQLHVPAATRDETFSLLLHTARKLEGKHRVAVEPFALRSLVDLGATLLPTRALPGKSVDLLRELARTHAPAKGTKTVGSREVLELLSKKTGIPELLLRRDTLLAHEDVVKQLEAHVMGQPEAVRAMADLVLRIKVGATDPHRPYGVYLFTGPTGTGKTELAKCMAELVYGSPSRLLRFDMSELSGPDAPARLIGHRYAPEGVLTSAVQRQPFSVVLFDEIEKAHRSVQNLLLQLFDEGRLTDAAGVAAHFTHAIVIMTSNLGSRARAPVGFGDASASGLALDVAKAVREHFAPELFNRIDRIVPFRPLSREVAERIADRELDKLLSRGGLADRNIFVARSSRVGPRIADVAFRVEDGARSIKRHLEDTIGALVTSAITERGAVAIQILRVDVASAGSNEPFVLERKALREVDPEPATFALEALDNAPPRAIKARLRRALDGVRALEADDGPLAALSQRIRERLAEHTLGNAVHVAEIYDLDAMRIALKAFRERVELAFEASDQLATYEDVERAKFSHVEVGPGKPFTWRRTEGRYRLFSRLGTLPPRELTERETLDCIAEAAFLDRALSKSSEPGQHAVFVELLAAGRFDTRARFSSAEPGFIAELAVAYASARGELDGCAFQNARGEIEAKNGLEIADFKAGDPALVVLKIVGLCVLDALELERGVHVFYSSANGPELVRVRVLTARPDKTPADLVREHVHALSAFERGEQSDNPAELGAVVRTVRVSPSPARGSLIYAIEDYATAFTDRAQAASLKDALASLWMFTSSREAEASS